MNTPNHPPHAEIRRISYWRRRAWSSRGSGTLQSRTLPLTLVVLVLFAFLYDAVGVPIAAGVLYPLTGLLLSPMIAALAMSLSSVSVVANALRSGKTRFE